MTESRRKHSGIPKIARASLASVMALSLAAMPAAGFAASIDKHDDGVYVVNAPNANVVIENAVACFDAGSASANALSLYLSGKVVSADAIAAIDATRLDADFPVLAGEIRDLQNRIAAKSYDNDYTTSASDAASGGEGEGDAAAAPETPAIPADPATPDTPAAPDGTDPATPGSEEPAAPADPETPATPATPENPDADAPAAGDGAAAQPAPAPAPVSPQVPPTVNYVPVNENAGIINATIPTVSQLDSVDIEEYVPSSIVVSLTTEKFIGLIGEQAREIAAENDLYASVMIAQAILESGSGSSALSRAPYNNLFGIKGFYKGKSVNMRTAEDDGSGNYYSIRSDFRRYPTLAASLSDYANLLTKTMGTFYAPTWKTNAKTYVDACDYLQGHYATSTTYSKKLQLLIEAYDLTRYDEPVDYVTVDEYEVPSKDEFTGEAVVDEQTKKPVMEKRGLSDLASTGATMLGADYSDDRAAADMYNRTKLIRNIYKQAMGVEVSPHTVMKAAASDDVALEDLHTGDLLFFKTEDDERMDMALYLSNGCFIEANKDEGHVIVGSFDERMPAFAKRIIEVRGVDEEPEEEAKVIEYDEFGVPL